MVKILNPLQPVYIYSNVQVNDSILSMFYLFPGATVLYKEKEYVITYIGNGGLSIADQIVKINDRHLSVPPYLFQENFYMWANSLQVGELVDICSEDLHHEWSLGIVESIKTENGLVVSLSVIVEQADDCQDGHVGMDIHAQVVVITEVNHRSVSRPFLM